MADFETKELTVSIANAKNLEVKIGAEVLERCSGTHNVKVTWQKPIDPNDLEVLKQALSALIEAM